MTDNSINNTVFIGIDHGRPNGDKSCEITYSVLKDGTIKIAEWRVIEPKPPLEEKRQ